MSPKKPAKKRKSDGNASDEDEMPTRGKKKEKKPDDEIIIVDEVIHPPSLYSQVKDVKVEEEIDQKIVLPEETINQSINPIANLMTTMAEVIKSQTEMIMSTAKNSAESSQEETSAKEFINFLKMYIDSLKSPHLKDLQNVLSQKIQQLSDDPKIGIDRLRLAIEAAIGIITA